MACGTNPLHAAPAEDGCAVYGHIPLCASRCAYCNFFTTTRLTHQSQRYAEALAEEARQVAASAGSPLRAHSLYLGGGTPSVLPAAALSSLVSVLRGLFGWQDRAEFTVEVNPGDASASWLEAVRGAGVNRLSLGMQAADEETLALLGRRHRHDDTRRAVGLARCAGLQNISLDLLYGIPGQSLARWKRSVEAALELDVEHLSAYCLSLEPGTPMSEWVQRGMLEAPDDDRAAELYEWLAQRLDREGYVQYEISNWARGPLMADGQPRFACRHNLTYWENRPYLGLGAGAHGYAAGVRYSVWRSVRGYIERVMRPGARSTFPLSAAVQAWRRVTPQEAADDTLLLGLRLTASGVDAAGYTKRHGAQSWQRHRPTLDRLAAQGLIEWVDNGRRVRLTPRGRLVGNQVFREFV